MWSKNLHVKICRWGGEEKEPKKLTIVNTFVYHILVRKITHSAIITHKTFEKMKNLKCVGEKGKEYVHLIKTKPLFLENTSNLGISVLQTIGQAKSYALPSTPPPPACKQMQTGSEQKQMQTGSSFPPP